MTFPDVVTAFEKTYIPKVTISRHRFAWDDENPDYGYKCRTQTSGFVGPDNPPAVMPFYSIRDERDRQRINLTADPSWRWEETIVALNGGGAEGEHRFNWWINANTAQFNTTGWAQMAYLGMCGNEINVLERIGDWVKFETMRPDDWDIARNMSIATRPCYIHRFTCVTWNAQTKTTKRILSTGTARGDVFYPLVTVEGYAYIPARHVVRMS
jgi:hypothetical protein